MKSAYIQLLLIDCFHLLCTLNSFSLFDLFFAKSVFSFIAELEDEDHAKPSPSVIDSNDQAVSSYIKNVNGLEPMEEEVKCKNFSDQMYAFTVAVGKKSSHASAYVEDAREVASLLIELTGETSNWKMRATSFDAIKTGSDLFR